MAYRDTILAQYATITPMGYTRQDRVRIEAGLCVACHQPRGGSGGKAYCRACLENLRTTNAQRTATRLSLGLCANCGASRGDAGTNRLCRICADATSRRTQALRQRRMRGGGCLICGEPTVSGRARCEAHRLAGNRSAAERRARLTAAGRCLSCGKPPLVAGRTPRCETCYLKYLAGQHLGDSRHWTALRDRLAEQQGRCFYTGETLILGKNDSLDHVLPRSRFPEYAHDPANVRWTTKIANLVKRDLTGDEFIALAQRICRYHSAEGSDGV